MHARFVANDLHHERLKALIDGRSPDFSSYNDEHPQLVAEELAAFIAQRDSYRQRCEVIEHQITQRRFLLSAQQAFNDGL